MNKMKSLNKSVGVIVAGKPVMRGGNMQFDVDHVLGSGFVVDSEKALIATCEHVLPEEDRELNIAFFTTNDERNWIVSRVDTKSIKQWNNEDLIVCQCLDLNNKPKVGLKQVNINNRKLNLAEKMIVLGLPKDHMLTNEPGNNTVVIRSIVGHVVTTYETTAEIETPLIKGMSGGPVLSDNLDVVGIAIENKRVALDLELVTSESTSDGSQKEEYSYGEYQRFGCFYHSYSFFDWLQKTIDEF